MNHNRPDERHGEHVRMAAHLAAQYPAVRAHQFTDPLDATSIPHLYIDTPAGQLRWRVNPRDLDLFRHVPLVAPDDPRAEWDGHTPEERAKRLEQITEILHAEMDAKRDEPTAELPRELRNAIDDLRHGHDITHDHGRRLQDRGLALHTGAYWRLTRAGWQSAAELTGDPHCKTAEAVARRDGYDDSLHQLNDQIRACLTRVGEVTGQPPPAWLGDVPGVVEKALRDQARDAGGADA